MEEPNLEEPYIETLETSFSRITEVGVLAQYEKSDHEMHDQLHRIHSIIMSLRPSKTKPYKIKPRFQVNLASLPMDVVKKIAAQLEPEERILSVNTLGQRFNDVCYDVLSNELRNIGPMIYGQLEDSKDEVMTTKWNSTMVNDLMYKMSQYSLLQILNGEYNLLCCVYLDREGYISKKVMNYQIIDNLNEFNNLLRDSADKKFDWQAINVNDTINSLRLFNQKAFEMFFMRSWNIKVDRFGPLLMKILNCAMNSNFRISLSHLEIPRRIDSKCYIYAQYEIADVINTLEVPPFFLLDLDRFHFLKLFLLFICNSIRMENINTTLRVRRACLNLAINSEDKMTKRRWFEKNFPYVDCLPILLAEDFIYLPTDLRKVTRVIEKPGESLSNTPGWQGMRFDFKLWCPVIDAPVDFFRQDFLEALYDLAYKETEYEGEHQDIFLDPYLTSEMPYEFKLNFTLYVKAKSQIKHSDALVEHCITIKESTFDVHVAKGKGLIR